MLLLISLLVLAAELCCVLRRRIEEILPCEAAGAVLLCFLLAMARRLSLFVWIIPALALTGLGWLAVRAARGEARALARDFARLVFTPGLVIFAALAALYVIASEPHVVCFTDDLYVWCLQPRSLWARDGFVGPLMHFSPRFMTYTPGAHLFQWIGLAIGGEWSESTVYLWLWLFYATMLIPLTRRVTWRRAWQIPLWVAGLLTVPALFDSDAYQILRVDAALGLCLGYTLVQAWRLGVETERRGFLAVSLALGMALLALVKQPGVGWALLPTGFVLGLGIPRRGWKKSAREAALCFCAALAAIGAWLLFCRHMGLTGVHTTAIRSGIPPLSAEELLGLLQGLWTAVAVNAANGVPQLVLVALFALAPLLLLRMGRMDPKAARLWSVGLLTLYVLYVGAFLIALLTAFRGEWHSPVDQAAIAPLLGNVQRYGCALWYGLVMLTASLLTNEPALSAASPARLWSRRAALTAACALLLACVRWDVMAFNLLPGRYEENGLHTEMTQIADGSLWLADLENPAQDVVLLASDSYPYNRDWLQYALAPAKIVTPYEPITQESFPAFLKGYGITHFVSEGSENELYAIAQSYAADGWLDEYTAYAVTWPGETPVLVSVWDLETP